MSGTPRKTVRAAGTLPWRLRRDRLEVALIHRPHHDDWSWPKGKLDRLEAGPTAAARETAEETGLRVRLGLPLPSAEYEVGGRDGASTKSVDYWSARVLRRAGRPDSEVDGLDWLDADAASTRLTYGRDREQLDALRAAHDAGTLTAVPVGIVRHAKALPRKQWPKKKKAKDYDRPLLERGHAQSVALVPVFAAYDFRYVLTSASKRCFDTVHPYAKSARARLEKTKKLSEESFEERPGAALKSLREAVEEAPRRGPTLVCSHGPLLPELVRVLADRADDPAARDVLAGAVENNLAKGELLVGHVVTEADGTWRVVAAERHLPELE